MDILTIHEKRGIKIRLEYNTSFPLPPVTLKRSIKWDAISEVVLEYPTSNGLIISFKDNTPKWNINLEDPAMPFTVKIIWDDGVPTLAEYSTNSDLFDAFDEIMSYKI